MPRSTSRSALARPRRCEPRPRDCGCIAAGTTFASTKYSPLPGYLDAVLSTGRSARDLVMSHGDRVRLSPIKGCVYDCGFCDLGELRYERRDFAELREALD